MSTQNALRLHPKPYYRLLGATPVTVWYQAEQGNRTKVSSENGNAGKVKVEIG